MKYQVGCFQHKKKWLSSFYGLTIYFILMGFFVCSSVLFLLVSSIFYSINYLLTVGSLVT